MNTKYLRSSISSMYASQKRRKRACRGLCVSILECEPPLEDGLYLTAGIATVVLTIVLFATWFVAG